MPWADMVFEDSTTKTKLTFEVALFHHSPVAAPAPGVERLRKTEVGAVSMDRRRHSR